MPKGHPLALPKGLTLKDIAAYPIITYHEGYTGRGQLDKAFADEGLAPDIVMSALDADVIKAYVEFGPGYWYRCIDGVLRRAGYQSFAA